ncbi:DUF6993 domain-containing protein [Microbacterium xylanilyticum]
MLKRPAIAAPRAIVAALGALAVALSIAGCGPATHPGPSGPAAPAGTALVTAPPSRPETAAAAPALVPSGSADDNLPLFRAVTDRVWASDQRASGRAYIDALAAAGFDRAAMQLTEDHSTVGNPAESIQFSVRWGDRECLVGQVGPSTGDPVAAVLPQLDGGACLVGRTATLGP